VQRFVNCTDVVTQIPPALLGYVHVQGEQYVDRSGRLQPGADGDFKRQDGVIAAADYALDTMWRPGMVAFRGLADHSPINYVSAVGGWR
jgi:hypothetical protein